MLTNYHTHSTFCDGKNTPEQTVLAAIEKGFSALGFSGHGYTEFDLHSCMTDTGGYIAEVERLKKKYENKIQIYLGIEEDMFGQVKRSDFEYIIGSMHYIKSEGRYYPLDLAPSNITDCLEIFNGDSHSMAEAYYQAFCSYIKDRRPDIVGHFDLITKFDEKHRPIFLGDGEYDKIAERYLGTVADLDCIFEVNTGAISRGHRTAPYPNENLLYVLKKHGSRIMLSSDCHFAEALDCHFEETKKLLRDVGFSHAYALYDGQFIRYAL